MLGLTEVVPLTWKARVHILNDVFRALTFLHTRTASKPVILHRDVKPSNILLDQHGTAFLADCGLAKSQALVGAGATHLSTTHMSGTPGFVDQLIINGLQHSERKLAAMLKPDSMDRLLHSAPCCSPHFLAPSQ